MIPTYEMSHDHCFGEYLISHGFPKKFIQPGAGLFVCGGAWRSYHMNESPNDIDVYCSSEEKIASCELFLNRSGHMVTRASSRAVQYRTHVGTPIHLVKKVYGKTVKDVLDSFDFDVCMFGTDFQLDRAPLRSRFHRTGLKSPNPNIRKIFNPLRINKRVGALSMLSHAMRLRNHGLILTAVDFVNLVERAGVEITILRASGTDPVKIMGAY